MPDAQQNGESLYYVGVDGGGTKCRAVLADAKGEFIGCGEGGPANPYQNFERAIGSINHAIDSAIASAGLTSEIKTHLVAGLGLAGVNVPSVSEKVKQHPFPFLSTYVTTDLRIATFAAHEQVDGAVLVIGTGSCGYSYVKGQSLSIGGHGFPLGDKGSGAWLGLAAIQAVLLEEDKLGPATLLTKLVGEHFNASGIHLIERLSGAGQTEFATFAPLVFAAVEQSDSVALAIVQDGAAYLSALTKSLLKTSPPRISVIGGLADYMIPWMDPEVTQHFSPSKQAPEMGAVFFAQDQFRKNVTETI